MCPNTYLLGVGKKSQICHCAFVYTTVLLLNQSTIPLPDKHPLLYVERAQPSKTELLILEIRIGVGRGEASPEVQ